MRQEPATAKLPEGLLSYFWDYDTDRLSWDRSRDTIVKRLLQSGGLDASIWLRQQLGDRAIRDFITRRQGRGMEPRRLRFWGVVLGIPRAEVDEWVAAARSRPWGGRGNR